MRVRRSSERPEALHRFGPACSACRIHSAAGIRAGDGPGRRTPSGLGRWASSRPARCCASSCRPTNDATSSEHSPSSAGTCNAATHTPYRPSAERAHRSTAARHGAQPRRDQLGMGRRTSDTPAPTLATSRLRRCGARTVDAEFGQQMSIKWAANVSSSGNASSVCRSIEADRGPPWASGGRQGWWSADSPLTSNSSPCVPCFPVTTCWRKCRRELRHRAYLGGN